MSELQKLKKGACKNIFHGNSARLDAGVRRCVCRKDVAEWRICLRPQRKKV